MKFGYNISSEEHAPNDLVHNAQRAEEIGFEFALISDHYHPWMDVQGHAPFIWSIIGAIAHATHRLSLGTGVTCPIMRIHPAILAQATATVAAMMPGRFFFGVGTGENLNEHIFGDHWPPTPVRFEMLEEALQVIRLLWQGEEISHYGKYYTVENARLYTLPDELPPIYLASSAKLSAKLAGRIGDGLISTSPDKEVVENFNNAGGEGKPRYVKVDVCYAASEEEGRKIAYRQWANTGINGQLNQEIASTPLMEMAAAMVTEADVAKKVLYSRDPEKHIEEIHKHIEAGFDHIYMHQIGPDQELFFRFYEQHILPEFL
jgi:G6PDH family F420-dependent oxidoreductase